ncbi:MAG: DpnII family type II restriction endonuclease [Nitrososphaeria archaeon]
MVRYDLLGFNSLEEFKEDFFMTLLKTGHTYDFFVDWKKVEDNARKYIIECGLLNSLTLEKSSTSKKDLLRNILFEHPRILECAPLLLAVREKELEVAEIAQQIIYRRFNFQRSLDKKQIDDAVLFFEKTGLLSLFDKIKDTYTYLLGIEVGLDSNARKNRSGAVFSRILEHALNSAINEVNLEGYRYSYESEVDIKKIINTISLDKRVDFIINHGDRHIAACEVNIYHGPGSKPLETARSYMTIGNELNKCGLHFIWFTDGPGWIEMRNPFNEASEKVELILNYCQTTKFMKNLLKKMTKP